MYNPCTTAKVGYWAPVGIRYAQVQSKVVSPTIGHLAQLPAGGGLLVLAGLAYFVFRKK